MSRRIDASDELDWRISSAAAYPQPADARIRHRYLASEPGDEAARQAEGQLAEQRATPSTMPCVPRASGRRVQSTDAKPSLDPSALAPGTIRQNRPPQIRSDCATAGTIERGWAFYAEGVVDKRVSSLGNKYPGNKY